MPSNHLILCCPLLLMPSIFPSIRVFSNESTLLMRWPKYWSFRFNISPSNEHPGLIFFRMDWLDLLAVQGTLKSLLQHHSSKSSILLCSAFFTAFIFFQIRIQTRFTLYLEVSFVSFNLEQPLSHISLPLSNFLQNLGQLFETLYPLSKIQAPLWEFKTLTAGITSPKNCCCCCCCCC